MLVQSLGSENPLEEGMATLHGILGQKVPWTEELGGVAKSWTQLKRLSMPACTTKAYIKK